MSAQHRPEVDVSTEPLWLCAPDRPWAPVLSGLTMLAVAALAAAGLAAALSDMGTVPTSAPSTGGAATAVLQPGPEGDR